MFLMFLALRELRHSRLRFVLIGTILTLIAWLVFLLSGLANGLAMDNAAAIQRMPADAFVFQADSRLLLQRSLLPLATVEQVRQVPGVTAAPLGQLTLSFKRATGGDLLDATMLGIDPASFLAPPIVAGQRLQDAPAGGVVVDQKLADHGVHLGDTLIVQPSGTALTVAGFTSGQTYSHMPVIYAPLTLWQHLRFPTPEAAGQIAQPISAIAVQADNAARSRIANAVPGVEVGSRSDTVKHLPGYTEETGTLTMIQAFLFVIAALLIAAFFFIVTLQKTAQFGVLKAI
ncbi:MAG TPA: hypothetical protein VIG44_01795, partial [Thermomicrobiales bacterium]